MLDIYDCGDGLHPSPRGCKRMVDAINNLNVFTLNPDFDKEKYMDDIEIVDKIGIKYNLGFSLEKGEKVKIRIKGRCEESYGFRVLTNDNQGEKTSDYYYSGNLEKTFDLSFTMKIYETSNFIIIRRPLSTINIDNIILSFISIEAESGNKILDPSEGRFL